MGWCCARYYLYSGDHPACIYSSPENWWMMTEEDRGEKLKGMPRMPWRIFEGRQVPGPDTPEDADDEPEPNND